MTDNNFENRLKKYIRDASAAHTEASKAYLFLEIVKDIFRGYTRSNLD